MRNQEWYHDVSEQESDEEIRQITDERPRTRRTAQQRRAAAKARAFNRVALREHAPGLNQLQQDTQSQGPDENTTHQRITRFLAEYQRREANNRGNQENRLDQFRQEFQEAMTEHALSSANPTGNAPPRIWIRTASQLSTH